MIHEKRHWEIMRDIGDIIRRHWETLGDNKRQKGDTGGEIMGDIQRHNWRHWKMTGATLVRNI